MACRQCSIYIIIYTQWKNNKPKHGSSSFPIFCSSLCLWRGGGLELWRYTLGPTYCLQVNTQQHSFFLPSALYFQKTLGNSFDRERKQTNDDDQQSERGGEENSRSKAIVKANTDFIGSRQVTARSCSIESEKRISVSAVDSPTGEKKKSRFSFLFCFLVSGQSPTAVQRNYFRLFPTPTVNTQEQHQHGVAAEVETRLVQEPTAQFQERRRQ